MSENPRRELADLVAAVRREAERLRDRGVSAVRAAPPGAVPVWVEASPRRHAAPQPVAAPKPAAVPQRDAARAPAPVAKAGSHSFGTPGPDTRGKKLSKIPVPPAPPDHEERMAQLAALREEASTCTKCDLCRTRTQVVFGTGQARTPVMFIGEAPGEDEDRLGDPFVGRAGKLLDQILDAVGFARDEVYIANILKCRPPKNRDPLPPEMAACTPYLERQIELVKPKIICALGRFAAGFVLGKPDASLGSLRGKVHSYKDRIMVVATYHPAALLRNPGWKRATWEDVQLLRREYLR